MVAPIRFLSGRQQQQKIGIVGETGSEKVLEVVGLVGIGQTIFDPKAALDIRGNAEISGILTSIDLSVDSSANLGSLSVGGLSTFTGLSTFQSSVYHNSFSYYPDSAGIYFGDSNELAIFHGGSENYIQISESNPYDLIIGSASSTIAGFGYTNGSYLYYRNSRKFETTGYGVTVYDTLQTTNLNISGISSLTTVGIGTTNPTAVLDVNGQTELDDLNVSGLSTFSGISSFFNDVYVNQNIYGISTVSIYGDPIQLIGLASTDYLLTANSGAGVTLYYNNVEKVSTTSFGATVYGTLESQQLNITGLSTLTTVGIGTTNPVGTLDVVGHTELDNLNVSGVSTFGDTVFVDANLGIATANPKQRFQVGELFVVTSNSDVGIGTTNPNAELDVFGHTELDTLNVSAASTFTGDIDANGNLDVDGHTELDNLNVSGVSTFVGLVGFANTQRYVGSYFAELHENPRIEFAVITDTKTSENRFDGVGSPITYFINGKESPYLTFVSGKTYRFIQEDPSNTNHTLRFYTDSARSIEYSTDVTVTGTPGNSGAYTEIVVTENTPALLYYESDNDDTMGNQAQIGGSSVFFNNVGLGTTNPTQQLQVGSEFVVDSNGNTGIGSLTPVGKLDVNGQTELDDLNVSGVATITTLGVSGITTTNNLIVSGVSTFSGFSTFSGDTSFNQDIDIVLPSDGSAIGIGTTAFDTTSGYIIDIRGNVNITGALDVGGQNIQEEVTSEQGTFAGVAVTNLYVTGFATFLNNPVEMQAGLNVTGGDINFDNETFYLQSAENQIGIGTTNPEATLDVVGDVAIDGNLNITGYTTTTYLTVGLSTDPYTFPEYDGVSNSFLQSDGNGNVDWFVNEDLRQVTEFSAGAGQTTFNVTYAPGLVDVFLNGVKLSSNDYVGTSGTTIVLNVGAASTDRLEVVAFSTSRIASRSINLYWQGDDVGNIFNLNDNVGIGMTLPTAKLDVDGDARIRGGLYDVGNNSGAVSQVPVADGAGGWTWSGVPAVGVSTAGGSPKNIQFHNAIGVIGGSNEFNFDFNTNRVGIGSTTPREKLDVRGKVYIEDEIRIAGLASVGIGTTNFVNISSGIITAYDGIITYYGDGSQLSDINAGNITSGTIGTDRLSGTYNINISGSLSGDLAGNGAVVGILTVTDQVIVGSAATFNIDASTGNLFVAGITTLGVVGVTSIIVGSGVGVTTILDEDDLTSNSDTSLATQQSIKAYVDATDLSISADSGSGNVILDTETLTISGTANEIETSALNETITIGLPDNVIISGIITSNTGFANTMTYSNTITGITTDTNPTALYDDLDATVYRTVEYSVQATEGTNYHFTKLLAVSDGTAAYVSEYGTVYNNSSVASFNVDVAGGYIRIVATAGAATTTNYVVNFTANKLFP